MFEISKSFDFCYGHRVWKQKLDVSCSLDGKCTCRALHGHNGNITITLRGTELDASRDMVVDFKELGWFKKVLDDKLDHKMILDISDPLVTNGLFPEIVKLSEEVGVFEVDRSKLRKYKEGFWIVREDVYSDLLDADAEMYEGLVFVDFCPTSEKFSEWIHGIVKRKMSAFPSIHSIKVQFSETPKSTAVYYE